MSNEMEMTWKDSVVVAYKMLFRYCLEGLKKPTKILFVESHKIFRKPQM
jgi:hypothetical protein